MADNGSPYREPAPHYQPPGDDKKRPQIVVLGASSGGLEAATEFVKAIRSDSGMAFILVQHLDPAHESMLVDLLSAHSKIPVRLAVDGMRIEPDCFYVIPPAAYLSVSHDALRITKAFTGRGARLPFDFLLNSVAETYAAGAVAVVLSGTGADGSRGIKSVREKGGLVIAQDPVEAAHDGMPRNAVMTGAVDLVLPVGKMADALVSYRQRSQPEAHTDSAGAKDWLPEILTLIRHASGHDFHAYKDGTLRRRIDRRRALASIESGDMAGYLDLLKRNASELDLLVKDLLINVTSFLRDPDTFALLSDEVFPELVADHPAHQPIRLWVAGCSTGEEAYSFAMLLIEQISALRSNVRVQIFASDVDEDAVLAAREGLYPLSIESEVSAERLARFFIKEEGGYRATAELRSCVLFAVHDVLSDPPFSRLDLISCRNLLIYFGAEAQSRLLALFHFALKDKGLLLLGGVESAGDITGRFEVVSKTQKLYRRIGRSRPGDFGHAAGNALAIRNPLRPEKRPTSRSAGLGDLCRRLVLENYAPAAALIDAQHECLYTLGPLNRYLRIAQGFTSHNLLAMAPPTLRTRLRVLIEESTRIGARASAPGGQIESDGGVFEFALVAQPVLTESEPLTLVCFIEGQRKFAEKETQEESGHDGRVEALEQELNATRLDLQTAIRELEQAAEEQKTISEEALSVSEEFQSTNEELLTSKEELQSLNEELTTLNTQLQETLDQQRRSGDDLQNVLYSTNIATLFLDAKLRIRFYTPPTRSLFSLIPSDVGRPLADLNVLSTDVGLVDDARKVLERHAEIEREIQANNKAWFARRVRPYRTQKGIVEGVVVTFSDITERRLATVALEDARRMSDQANAAKTRFLAAASHDLRQPLQTLSLLHGLLASKLDEPDAQQLLARVSDTLGTMSGMLNTLLDVNQIEAGTIRVALTEFRIGDLFDRLKAEFEYQAVAQGVELRVRASSAVVRSDQRLLEQALRNLLSNALKYTSHGKILLGCKREKGSVRIEVRDTGSGIAADELPLIFDEYYQSSSSTPSTGRRGLGLGLSIVKRLADLRGHEIDVQSVPGKGSMFSITTERAFLPAFAANTAPAVAEITPMQAVGTEILAIDDDPEIGELLALLFSRQGYKVVSAAGGEESLKLVAQGKARPDLILADFNLSGALNGVEAAKELRVRLGWDVPIVILSGDISTATLRAIDEAGCERMSKPVDPPALLEIVARLLSRPKTPVPSSGGGERPLVYVIDDDPMILSTMRETLERHGNDVAAFHDGEAFFQSYRSRSGSCLLVDVSLPGMSGLDVLRRLRQARDLLPTVMITGVGEISIAVEAMKVGASNFISKPVSLEDLLAAVRHALDQSFDTSRRDAARRSAADQISGLTERQRDILDRILLGHPNKIIAGDLGVSQRTVENHRAAIMAKTGAKSLPDLVRLAAAAASVGDD